jgi:flagellar motor switch protein FliG
MLSIGEVNSALLFERMEDEEIRDVSLAMVSLGSVSAEIIERLFDEFSGLLSGAGGLVGSNAATERLLLGSMSSDRVKQIMSDIRGPEGRTMWDKLGNVNEDILANYLKNEYPQTVAVVLSKIKPDHASRVLALLPENFSLDCVMRMLRLEAVQKDILDHIERTLRTEIMTDLSSAPTLDSHEVMANIFNNLDSNTEERFMTALEERDKESAERIKSLMFTFNDLSKIDPAGIQLLLGRVDKDKLGLALKGASEEVQELFFLNMSKRAGKMMKEDMEALGAVRLKDVEEAQSTIVQVAKALSDTGEIVISSGGEEDAMIT